ncbi:MAG: copper chaperone CopZ [Rhodothermales bacterium]
MTTETLSISGMSCGHCVRAVETALNDLAGVTVNQVNLADGTAHVTYNDAQTPRTALVAAVEEEGYTVTG